MLTSNRMLVLAVVLLLVFLFVRSGMKMPGLQTMLQRVAPAPPVAAPGVTNASTALPPPTIPDTTDLNVDARIANNQFPIGVCRWYGDDRDTYWVLLHFQTWALQVKLRGVMRRH